MVVRKSFQFRLKLTKKQTRLLQEQLDECRWLYNELLSYKRLAYEELQVNLSKYELLMLIPFLKMERPSLEKVHSQVLQNVVDRLDKAFQAFFRRCKAGEKPGFPRFRGFDRYNSFCFPQSGFALCGNELKLSKTGRVRILQHRPIGGAVKTCTLRKNSSGSWDVSFSCEVKTNPLPPNEKAIGIDVGIASFAVLTTGEEIANPRFFKQGEKALAKAQRKLSKEERGTKKHKKKKIVIAKVHQKIRNQRKDFCHKESKKIVDQYQYICIEDLDIRNMVEGTRFAKSITDASWGQFRQCLTYKAEEAGRKLGLANPAYTSQDCSRCGHREKKSLSDRMHCCPQCGYTATRDFNAARNILALGLDGLGTFPRSLRL